MKFKELGEEHNSNSNPVAQLSVLSSRFFFHKGDEIDCAPKEKYQTKNPLL